MFTLIYRVGEIVVHDRTPHVETLVVLSKKSAIQSEQLF